MKTTKVISLLLYLTAIAISTISYLNGGDDMNLFVAGIGVGLFIERLFD